MQNFPHQYQVTADGAATGTVMITSANLPDWPTDAPAEFDGPGDVWSPETMLVGAVANCYILTFRAIARFSKFDWNQIACKAVGVLDRVDRVTQFTEMHLTVTLTAPAGADAEKAQRLLEKAEQGCLITNSLKGKVHTETSVQIG